MKDRTKVRTTTRALGTAAALIAVVALAGGQAVAQDEKEYREVSDRWLVQLGYAESSTTTDVFAGRTLGALISIEDVLDYDKKDNSFFLSGFYRFRAEKKGKHSILFSLTDSTRESSGVVEGEVPILEEEFVGSFSSSYKTRTFSVTYRYSLIKIDRAEAGITAGLSTIRYDIGIAGEIDSSGDGLPDGFADEGADLLAPLPTFGFFIRYGILHNLIFDISTSAIDIRIAGIQGKVLDTNARLAYYFTRNFGLAIATGRQDINVQKDSDTLFRVDFRQSFGTFGVTLAF